MHVCTVCINTTILPQILRCDDYTLHRFVNGYVPAVIHVLLILSVFCSTYWDTHYSHCDSIVVCLSVDDSTCILAIYGMVCKLWCICSIVYYRHCRRAVTAGEGKGRHPRLLSLSESLPLLDLPSRTVYCLACPLTHRVPKPTVMLHHCRQYCSVLCVAVWHRSVSMVTDHSVCRCLAAGCLPACLAG